MKRIVKKAGEELAKTGKTALKQIKGEKSADRGIENISSTAGKTKKAQKQKKTSGKGQIDQQLQQMIVEDNKKREEGLSQTRAELEREKIKRYSQIQREQLQAGRQRQQEKEQKEKEEQAEKERKKKEKEEQGAQGPQLPTSTSKQPGLDRIKGKQGTKEMGKKKIG